MKDYLVSVVIPTYNRASTISRAIESVLNQTYQNIEIIIVDDGSTDNTEDIVTKYISENVRYYKQDNNGACSARNYGIQLSKGDYIAFQDSDDYWRFNKIEKELNALMKNDADMVFCQLQRHAYGNNDGVFPELEEGFINRNVLMMDSCVSTQTILAKREILLNEQFDVNMPRFQDYDLIVRISRNNKIYFCKDVLVDLYLQEDSISSNMEKTIIAHRRLLDKYKDDWKEYPEILAFHNNAIGMVSAENGIYEYKSFARAYWATGQKKYILKYLLAKIGILRLMKNKKSSR